MTGANGPLICHCDGVIEQPLRVDEVRVGTLGYPHVKGA